MPFKSPRKRTDYHRKYNAKRSPAHPGFRNRYNWRMRGLDPNEAEKLYNSAETFAIFDTHLHGRHKHLDHDHGREGLRVYFVTGATMRLD